MEYSMKFLSCTLSSQKLNKEIIMILNTNDNCKCDKCDCTNCENCDCKECDCCSNN